MQNLVKKDAIKNTRALVAEAKKALEASIDVSQPESVRKAATLRYLRLERKAMIALKHARIPDRISAKDLACAAKVLAAMGHHVMASRIENQPFRNLRFVPFRNRAHIREYLVLHIDEKLADNAIYHIRG